MSKRIDLYGERFGRLTVVSREKNSNNGHARWRCKCDCGTETIVSSSDLRGNKQVSCGCYNYELKKARKNRTIHGLRNHKLYGVWRSMKERCMCVTHYAYKDYGGRGITVCKEWIDDFIAFYEWAMKCGYTEGLTLDRIDNDKGYYPDNCRWVTMAVQNANKRNTLKRS